MQALICLSLMSVIQFYDEMNTCKIKTVLWAYSVGGEPGSSVSIVSGYGLDDQAIGVRTPAEAVGFFL
jgi:hypothetical protein